MQFKKNKIPNSKILVLVMLLITPIFIVSCVDNKGQGSRADSEYNVPEELVPEVTEGTAITEGSGSGEGSGAGHEVINENYSPGDTEWTLPTQEEQDQWDHDIYVVALEKWAKPKLDNWTCDSCKGKLSKDFKFKSRDGNNIKFECKCDCGHTHTVTLQGK